MREATGRFDVTIDQDATLAGGIGRFSVSKIFEGGLLGSGTGTMLAARTATAGSAGYVLIEHVEGTLDGKQGSFLLQHSGIMERGQPSLRVVVIPDSGTASLTGLAGEMSIDPSAGHAYVLRYALPSPG